jgi:hypothetical protein
MAFEDITRTTAGSRYRGEGFRQELEFREGSTTATAAPPVAPDSTAESTDLAVRPAPARNLDYVFDDPADGEPGRDRVLVHGLWELVLAVAVGVLGYLLYRERPAAFADDGLRDLMLTVAAFGALVAASAVALRAAAPNLAVGSVAVAAAFHFTGNSGGGLLRPMLLVVGLAAAVGAAQALVTVGLHVPAWASGLGVAMLLLVWTAGQSSAVAGRAYDPTPHAYWWFGGLVAASLVASVVGLVPSVRRLFGRFRPVADPADRRGAVAAVVTSVAIVVSSVLAGVGGALASTVSSFDAGVTATSDGFTLTALALGAALLGGTSAYGRRGGIAGTVLASALVVVAMTYVAALGERWEAALFAAAALGLGLAVTRLVERFGRPGLRLAGAEVGEDDWAPRAHSAGRSWQPGTAGTTSVGGLWASDEAWGSTER